MKAILTLFVSILAWSANGPVSAEIPENIIVAIKEDSFERRIANVMFSAERDNRWSVTAIYSQPFSGLIPSSPEAPRRWIAKRRYGQGDNLSDRLEWADSASCPALEGVLWSMTRIPVPTIQVAGLARPRPSEGTPPIMISSHASVFTIWNSAEMLSGAPSWLKLTSAAGEMQVWGESAETNLAPCWRQETPRP